MLKQLTLLNDRKILINLANIYYFFNNEKEDYREVYSTQDTDGCIRVKETFEELLVIFKDKK